MNRFVEGYIEAMFFTDAGPDDEIPASAELSDDAQRRVMVDCANFQVKAAELLTQATTNYPYDLTQAGRDFWLTRNGHGVGFWDRDELTENLQTGLTQAAEAFGQCDMYLGDDGLVHLS